MPKLYYTATSCGAASFITAVTAGVNLSCEQVNLETNKTASGVDFRTIHEKGNVPCLVLDDGTVLNEGAAVLQWIADQAPGTAAPANGTTARYVTCQLINYVASEVHPAIGGLFANSHAAVVMAKKKEAYEKLKYVTWLLQGKSFLQGA